jgi:hypothetical protein
MFAGSSPKLRLIGTGLVAFAATVLLHVVYVPQYLPATFARGLPYLVVGWVSYGIVFYTLGRLRPIPDSTRLPSMRTADVGVALVLISIVLSGLLDTAGLGPSGAVWLHAPAAVGIYVGLALAGWGFGTRTRLVNEIAASDQSPPDP